MSSNVYSKSEIVGTSTTGIDDAISTAIARASSTLHGLDWFEVTEIRGHIEGGAVAHYQVTLKVGFRLDDPS
jgi:flavin-binding protein dodecin